MAAVQRLNELGLLKDDSPSNGELSDAVREFQRDTGLKQDGLLGTVTERWIERQRFCGVIPARQDRDAPCRWDHAWDANGWDGREFNKPESERRPLSLRWHFLNPPEAIYRELVREAFDAISGACAIVFEETPNPDTCNILIDYERIDGRGQTLAWCYLPCGPETAETLLKGKEGVTARADSGETPYWDLTHGPPRNGRVSFKWTMAHEFCHGVGLEHGGGDTSLMSPYANSVAAVDEWTRAQLVRRYGPPIETISAPVPDVPWIDTELRMPDGSVYRGRNEKVGDGR